MIKSNFNYLRTLASMFQLVRLQAVMELPSSHEFLEEITVRNSDCAAYRKQCFIRRRLSHLAALLSQYGFYRCSPLANLQPHQFPLNDVTLARSVAPIGGWRAHIDSLQKVAANLQRHITEHLHGKPNIDRISARAKTPERFAKKAEAQNPEGKTKYKAPLTEIQDQIGVRIVVFYKEDVEATSKEIIRYFQPIEKRDLVPESEWTFGYFGHHLVLALPKDVIPNDVDPAQVPRFFELQVKTLFQHAWSEANHDLGYKVQRPLSEDQQRRFAYTAAQAWGRTESLRNYSKKLDKSSL